VANKDTACKPADIQAQIEMLEKYKEMRTGVLARLDDDLCHRVLFFLNRQELLQLRLVSVWMAMFYPADSQVSKRFDVLATSPKVWKPLCRELETRWDGTIDLTNYHLGDDGDWFGLFKSLWQREKHWTNGEVSCSS
jgi:pyrimidine and pyridine-specific 5'-nucleotidase